MRWFSFFRVNPKYEVRHRILEYLYKRIGDHKKRIINSTHKTELNWTNVYHTTLIADLKISEGVFYESHFALHYADHDQVLCTIEEGKWIIGLH